MTYRASLKAGVDTGAGPYGNRVIVDVTGGTFEGPRLKGKLLHSGADWLLFDAEGVGHIDVRITLETDDGALIYVQYYGRIGWTEAVEKALAGEGQTEFGELEFFTQPRFETGDERYKWMNRVVAVGQGRVLPNAVEYQVFECVND
jgi:hypothetical protein